MSVALAYRVNIYLVELSQPKRSKKQRRSLAQDGGKEAALSSAVAKNCLLHPPVLRADQTGQKEATSKEECTADRTPACMVQRRKAHVAALRDGNIKIRPGCITHPQVETNEPQLRILLTPILSAHLNTKETRKDKDVQMALRYQNSLSSLITDKHAGSF